MGTARGGLGRGRGRVAAAAGVGVRAGSAAAAGGRVSRLAAGGAWEAARAGSASPEESWPQPATPSVRHPSGLEAGAAVTAAAAGAPWAPAQLRGAVGGTSVSSGARAGGAHLPDPPHRWAPALPGSGRGRGCPVFQPLTGLWERGAAGLGARSDSRTGSCCCLFLGRFPYVRLDFGEKAKNWTLLGPHRSRR